MKKLFPIAKALKSYRIKLFLRSVKFDIFHSGALDYVAMFDPNFYRKSYLTGISLSEGRFSAFESVKSLNFGICLATHKCAHVGMEN